MQSLLLFLIPVIFYGLYYTRTYDEMLLGKISSSDFFIDVALQYPLFVSYLLLFGIVGSSFFLLRTHIKQYIKESQCQRVVLIPLFLFFFLSFLPTNGAAGIILIPLYVQTIFFLTLFFILNKSFTETIKPLDALIMIPYTIGKKRLFALLFMVSIFTTISIFFLTFNHIPHIEDSISYLFQASIFSSGKLFVDMPELSEFFRFPSIVMHDNKWYSQYGPGYPFFLAIGVLINAPWIINPFFNALTILVIYFLAKELYEDERIARTAAILSLFSPFLVFMSSEYMSHTTCLFFVSLFLLLLIKGLKYSNRNNLFFAGIALGIVVNIRQTTGFLMLTPTLGYLVILLIRKEIKIIHLISFIIGVFVPVFFLLYYNYIVNDSPFVMRYIGKKVVFSPKNYGFALGKKFSLLNGLTHTVGRMNLLNIFLFEWPIPSLFFAMVALVGRCMRFEFFLFTLPIAILTGYFSREYLEICLGPRYLYETSGIYILFTSRGIVEIFSFLKREWGEASPKLVNARFFLVLLLFGFLLFYNLPKLEAVYAASYWRVNDELHKVVKEREIDNAVIFITDENNDWSKPFIWGAGFQKNSPLLDTSVIYAKDLKRRNLRLMAKYPDRNYYRYYYDQFDRGLRLIRITKRDFY